MRESEVAEIDLLEELPYHNKLMVGITSNLASVEMIEGSNESNSIRGSNFNQQPKDQLEQKISAENPFENIAFLAKYTSVSDDQSDFDEEATLSSTPEQFGEGVACEDWPFEIIKSKDSANPLYLRQQKT